MQFPIDLNRYEKSVTEKEQYPVSEGNVVLYGSSFFANWGYERAKQQLAGIRQGQVNVINHGFGGGTADEFLYYYPRLIRPYKPSAILWRGGPNDIFSGLSPEESWIISRRVFEWARKDFPDIRIGILNIFDYRSCKEEHRPLFARYNNLASAYAAETGGVSYIDINGFFYESRADIGTFKNFRDVFVEDGLHLTDAAYLELAAYMKPRIEGLLL